MIVADANLILGLSLRGDTHPVSLNVHRRDRYWCAPSIWRSEVRNALATQIRVGRLELPGALIAMRIASALVPPNQTFEMSDAEVLQMAANTGCTAYDSEYAALAFRLNVRLVTLDQKLLASIPARAVSPQDFVAGG